MQKDWKNLVGRTWCLPAFYRMMMLGTVLAQDLGIRYNPDLAVPQMGGKIPTLAQGANSKDVFIHGLRAIEELKAVTQKIDVPVLLNFADLVVSKVIPLPSIYDIEKMGFSETYTSVNEKRIIIFSGKGGDGLGCRMSKLIA
jgi:hypothetical protein